MKTPFPSVLQVVKTAPAPLPIDTVKSRAGRAGVPDPAGNLSMLGHAGMVKVNDQGKVELTPKARGLGQEVSV